MRSPRKLGWLVPLVLSGCGGSQPDGLGPIEDFILQSKQAACENDVTCGMMPDIETCLSVTFPERSQAAKTLGAAVAAGRVVFDAQAGQACIDGLRSLPCTASARIAGAGACDGVFMGTVAPGGTCVLHGECLSGECDFPPDDQSCSQGICARVVQDGESCETDTGTTCREGSYCEWSPAGTDICRKYSLIDEPCGFEQPCLPSLACPVNPMTFEFGTCTERAAAGGTCVVNMMLVGCDALDEVCGEVTQLCTPRSPIGAACEDDVRCPAYGFCGTEGTCSVPPTEGSCSTTNGGCLGQVQCNGGECSIPEDANACPLP